MKNTLTITLLLFSLILTSCDNKTLIGTWVGSSTRETTASRDYPYNEKITTNYTITIEKNGNCKIIEKITGFIDNNKPINVTYTYLGKWEHKSDYVGNNQYYDWIRLNGTTEKEYESTEYNTLKSSVYGELRIPNEVKRKKNITLSMNYDGMLWGGELNAKTLTNNPNSGIQLQKQNNAQTTEEPTVSVNDNIIEKKDNTPLEEPTKPILHEDVKRVALWVYTFDDGGYSISYELELFNNKSAVYRPCYDDCGYVGKYYIKGDSLIFEGSDETTDPDYPSKIRVSFLRKDGKLISESGEVYIDTSKPTMYEVVQMLTGRIFIGKKNNYYFTFDFTYTVLDEQDNAMFWCKYEEFELNSNYGSTPMEILKQSANSATFLKSEKLMVTVMKNDLQNNMIVVKRNRAYDDMPRFDFWITEIERDSEGNLEQARIDAQALGVRLNGIRK